MFHVGSVCGDFDFDRGRKPGHLHLVRSGSAVLIDSQESRPIDEPSAVFFPDARSHRLVSDSGVDLVCATVRFGVGGANPVIGALPALVVVRLREAPVLAALSALTTAEMQADRPGRQATLNRICELAVVTLLRHCLDHGLASGGTLAGLADARLAKALEAMHDRPQLEWSLDALAALAGMSRGRFATRFREAVDATPGDHLAACRIALAQQLLRRGDPLKSVAGAVGYASASALTRAFTRVVGTAPAHWLTLRSRGESVAPR